MSSWINRIRVQLLFWRAGACLRQRQVGQAMELGQRIVALDPDLVTGWNLLTQAQVLAHRFLEALESTDRVIAIEPQNLWAWNYRANALMRLERYDEAVTAFDRVCAFDEFASKRVTRLSQQQGMDALLKLRRYNDALAVSDILIHRGPHTSLYWAQRGLIFAEMRRPLEAEQAFRSADQYADGQFLQSIQLSNFYTYWMNAPQRALAVCDAFLALYPKNAGIWVQRGQCLMHSNAYRDALYAYERALACGGPSLTAVMPLPLLLNNYAITLMHQGQYARALEGYVKSEEGAPERASVMQNRGILFRRIERYVDALRWFEAALQAERANPRMLDLGDVGKAPKGRAWASTRNETAFALICLGRLDEAHAILEEVLASDPRNGYTLGCVGFLEIARGRADEALPALTTALGLEPREAPIHATYALALVAQGHPSEALRAVDYALSIDPFEARTWKIKAQALRAAGHEGEATEIERRSAELLAEQTAQVDAYLQAQAGS